jgi:threonine/homoserine/homoserine lactone efflux protein
LFLISTHIFDLYKYCVFRLLIDIIVIIIIIIIRTYDAVRRKLEHTVGHPSYWIHSFAGGLFVGCWCHLLMIEMN